MDTVSKVFGINPPKVAVSKLVGIKCANPTLVMGTELEIERCPKTGEWYIENLPKTIWQVTTDGSLRPQDSSYEFISKPLEMQAQLAELTSFFGKCTFDQRSYSDRTSVHVHTNVTDFTQEQLASLALVYTIVEDVLFQFVNHYKAPTSDGYSRDTNIYCIPWNQCRMNFSLVNNIFSQGEAAFRNWQKYTALNLLPVVEKGTVEWRHMHGTNDMEKLTIWLNLIGSIMKFAKTAEFEDVVKTVKALNDTSAYQQFYTSVLQDYLPYEDKYQVALAEGVINAKYSLINWETLKGKRKEPKINIEAILAQHDEALARQLNEAPVPAPRRRAAAVRRDVLFEAQNMFDHPPPWPGLRDEARVVEAGAQGNVWFAQVNAGEIEFFDDERDERNE